MGAEEHARDGNLRVAFATWVYMLHVAGIDADDAEVAERCKAVDAADGDEAGDAAGMALVERIGALLGDGDHAPVAVAAVAGRLYGERIATDLGDGDRDARAARIRKVQFGANRPWLARIWERQTDGRVAPSWLLVEWVTDQVALMDPNPWDDVDEERTLPVDDFQVLWELDGCTSIRIR